LCQGCLHSVLRPARTAQQRLGQSAANWTHESDPIGFDCAGHRTRRCADDCALTAMGPVLQRTATAASMACFASEGVSEVIRCGFTVNGGRHVACQIPPKDRANQGRSACEARDWALAPCSTVDLRGRHSCSGRDQHVWDQANCDIEVSCLFAARS
jgi:hypothetical protein